MAKKTLKDENRRFIRHPMCFPLTYKRIAKGDKLSEIKTTTKNISRGGLLFSSRKSVKPGERILINIPFQEKTFHVQAKVVHCSKIEGSSLYDIGISFELINDAFKVKLIEQLYLISEYRDLRSMQTGKEMNLQDASKEWIKRYSSRFSRLYW